MFSLGFRIWSGLEDYAPSPQERAAGWQGTFESKSSTYGLVGSIEARRFGSIGVGVELVLDGFSFATKEAGLQPDPDVSGEPLVTIDGSARRLGCSGRATFRLQNRVQPTAALGLAFDQVDFTSVIYFTERGVVQAFQHSVNNAIDFRNSGGFDIALQRKATSGWRGRIEACVEHRGYDQQLYPFGTRTPGPMAYSAVVGFVYRHEPTKPALPSDTD